MRLLMVLMSAVIILGWDSSGAFAQAAATTQRVVPKDICAGIPDADPSYCAQDAMWDSNWPAFLKWGQLAVAKGDYIVADWLGEEYEDNDSGLGKDLVRAYMWYDIAAELHARKIKGMPPASNGDLAEDNRAEINYRDAVGRKLSQQRITEALQLEKEWFASHR